VREHQFKLYAPRHPLFWSSNSQQSAHQRHQQAQIKSSRRDLVPLSEIFTLEGLPAATLVRNRFIVDSK
jgi:hypothetical protein